MSYFVIKGPSDSQNYLCDYRPGVECPQWYPDRVRSYKFATRDAAERFVQDVCKPWELGRMRVVQVFTRLDRRTERSALRAENERLRMIIRVGGAMYRAERASMGVPGGIDDWAPPHKPVEQMPSHEGEK